ncbi:MAG: hypothetical protein ACE5I1_13715 [bacterium]
MDVMVEVLKSIKIGNVIYNPTPPLPCDECDGTGADPHDKHMRCWKCRGETITQNPRGKNDIIRVSRRDAERFIRLGYAKKTNKRSERHSNARTLPVGIRKLRSQMERA